MNPQNISMILVSVILSVGVIFITFIIFINVYFEHFILNFLACF